MRCTECRTESTTGSKYCAACGSPFSSRCPKCGAENAPASVFCEDSGSELAVSATPASTRSSQTESTANNIRITPEQPAASPAIEGERKTVAPMFADIKGSMDLMEDLDPEEAPGSYPLVVLDESICDTAESGLRAPSTRGVRFRPS